MLATTITSSAISDVQGSVRKMRPSLLRVRPTGGAIALSGGGGRRAGRTLAAALVAAGGSTSQISGARKRANDARRSPSAENPIGLVTVVLGLVGAVDFHREVVGLLLGQPCELDADLLEMQAGDLLVEFLRQEIDADL